MTNEELAQAIQGGERERLPELWEQVQKLARYWANRYVRAIVANGQDTNSRELSEDFFQCGYIAMIAAVDTFDSTAEGSFSSWYSLYLRREIRSLMGWRSRQDPRTGESVTVISDAMAHASSLDAPIGDDLDGTTLQDTIPDTEDQYEDADRRVFNEQLHNALDDALGTLPDEESTAIRGTYYDGLTLRRMADRDGVTLERVRQRQTKGIRHIRQGKMMRKLRSFACSDSDIYAAGLHNTRLASFKYSGISSTERAAFLLADGKI